MVSTMVTTLATTKRSMVTIIIMDTPHRYGKLKFAMCKNNANTNLEDLVNEFYYLFTLIEVIKHHFLSVQNQCCPRYDTGVWSQGMEE